MRPYSQVLEKIRSVGLRPTRQRLALAKLLFEGEPRHVTAEMVRAEAQGASIRVSLATVYNTLHQFTKAGLLREIVVDPARSYFDTTTEQHGHFYHQDSGKLEDILMGDMQLANLPDVPNGTEISSVDVIVHLKKI